MPADDLFLERRRKIGELAALGVPSYNVDFTPTVDLDGARRMLAEFEASEPTPAPDGAASLGPEVSVAGRVMQSRLQGRSCFLHIEAEEERLQVWLRLDQVGERAFALVRLLDLGDIIGIRGNVMPGDGVYKSGDAGKTWTHVGFGNSDAISKIRIHPTNPDIVFVADFGRYGTPSDERGLYKSTDGGKTWALKKFVSDKAGFVDVALDPRDPNVVWASSYERVRGPYSLQSGGPGSALWKSTDAGETWTEVKGNGFPETMKGRISIAIAASANSATVRPQIEPTTTAPR